MDEDYIESDIDSFDEEYTRRDVRISSANLSRENIGRELETLCSNGIVTDENYKEVVMMIADRCIEREYRWPSQVKRGDRHYDRNVPIDKRFLIYQREGFTAYDRGLTAERVTKGMNKERKEILDTYLPGWLDEEDMWRCKVDKIASKKKERYGGIWPVPKPIFGEENLSKETLSIVSGMNEDEKTEFYEIGKFLRAQRKMLHKLATKRNYLFSHSKSEMHLFEERVAILDSVLPGWSAVQDQWDNMVKMLTTWTKNNPGKKPKLTSSRVFEDPDEEVSQERLLEHTLAMFLLRMQRARRNRGWHSNFRPRYGFTKARKKILDKQFPWWELERVKCYPTKYDLNRSRRLSYDSNSESREMQDSPRMMIDDGMFFDESMGLDDSVLPDIDIDL
jgi:hypothetical protein